MIIALNIIYLLLLISWALNKPTKFVIGFYIYVTSYFGFFTNDVLISNIEVGTFLSNLIPLFSAIKYRNYLKDKPSKYLILSLLLFYVYGLVKPIIDGHQNILMSIISSKAYTFYFLAIYLFITKDFIKFNKVFNFIFYTSIYYSILYVLNGAGIVIRPPEYIKGDGIQCRYDSFLTFSLFYLHSRICNIKKKAIFTILLFIGLYFGGFFSLLASSIVLLPFMRFLNKNWEKKSNIIVKLVCTIIPLIFFSHFFMTSQTYKDITERQSEALSSRNIQNEFRWQLIEKEYHWGYGFIHQNSHYISLYNNPDNQYMLSLSFIDSGYTDLMGKFGLCGTILFLLIPIFLMFKGLKNIKSTIGFIFIIQMFAVNITWSVFTFEMGIILLAIVYSYILTNEGHNKNENIKYYKCI